jgi:hypothetical protein
MRGNTNVGSVLGRVLLPLIYLLTTACGGRNSNEVLLIYSQIGVDALAADRDDADLWRFPLRSRIAAMPLDKPGQSLVLTEGFVAARAPEVSYDGRTLYFSGKKSEPDEWQIWRMDLLSKDVLQVTAGLAGCTEPVCLPDGRIAFSAITDLTSENHAGDKSRALFVIDPLSSQSEKLTFHTGTDYASNVLSDGRLLFAHRGEVAQLLTIRYDGTWLEPYYDSPGRWQLGRVWETRDNRLIFIESRSRKSVSGDMVAITNGRPLNSRTHLSSELSDGFHSLYPVDSQRIVVSYRPQVAQRFTLHFFDQSAATLGPKLCDELEYHAVEPVLAVVRPRPKTFVSLVDKSQNTGLIYCLNANMSNIDVGAQRRASVLQVADENVLLAEVPLAKDGSFYLEVPSDHPLRFTTLDQNGQVVRGPCAPIWVRPGEKHGCIGCHENRELAPENRAPLAVQKAPVLISVCKSTSMSIKHTSGTE